MHMYFYYSFVLSGSVGPFIISMCVFVGDAVNTKSKRQIEKLLTDTPAELPAISPPDSVKDLKSTDERHSLTHKAELAKDCKNRSKGKNKVDHHSTKSGVSSPAPRITIKLVAKKKMKTVKEPHKKSVKKAKVEGIQEQPKAKDIQDDQISSAHVKLKTEPHEDKYGTEEKAGGTLPARRRGRSAAKPTESICQSSTKVTTDDQSSKEKKSANQLDNVKDTGTAESDTNKTELKHKQIMTGQHAKGNQQGIRRSNRVTNTLSKRPSDSPAERGSPVKSDAVLPESKSKVSRSTKNKQSIRSDRQRQSKRLNKNVTVPEEHGPTSTETNTSAVQPTVCLPLGNEEMKVPSLKLIKIRNPKYGAKSSGKNSTRKKKRKKFIWTLTLVKRGGPTPDVENTVKPEEKTVNDVGQSSVCDSNTGTDPVSRLGNSAPQESNAADSNEKSSQKKDDVSLEESFTSQGEVESEDKNEASPQEDITKLDCGKVVPPLQIKKVSSPGKHRSSKPSFLIQQVSPVPEKQEDVLKDGGDVREAKSPNVDAEVLPTRRLRRRTPNLDSLQKKADSHAPATTKKQRVKRSPQVEAALQVHTEDSSQGLTEECSSHVVAENSSKAAGVNSSEVPDKDCPQKTDEPSQVPAEVSPPELEVEQEPPIKEAQPLPVPSKPRKKCKNNKVGKKRSVQTKVAVAALEAAVNIEFPTVDTTNTDPVLMEGSPAVVTETNQSEPKDSILPETQQDALSKEEETIPPPVKEETDIQLIDSQQSLTVECQEIDLNQLMHKRRKSNKKVKKTRKRVAVHHSKHKLRGRDGKFAPLKLAGSQGVCEENDHVSTQSATTEPAPGSRLIGVQKKYKKRYSGIQFLGSKGSKSKCNITSKLIEMGLDKDTLKREESDTLVDGAHADVVDPQPGKTKFVKNIKHFIMPVVSARSSRVIKTPQRFMDDIGMSVLPRRNSPKKGLQMGLQIRPGKRRDEGTGRAISPILSIDEEDILSEAQLDVDLFSAQDLSDSTDFTDSLFSETKSGNMEKKRPLLKHSSFRWHLPEESSEEMYTLDKDLKDNCENLFLSNPANRSRELLSTDFIDGQKKKPLSKFDKQTAHLKFYQKLKKGLPKSRSATETDSVSKPLQSPVDLAEGLDDEAMSISLRQRSTNPEKEKSKLKIEDLDTPGVVRKVSVCVRSMKSKSFAFQQDKEELAGKDTALLPSGKLNYLLSYFNDISIYFVQTLRNDYVIDQKLTYAP